MRRMDDSEILDTEQAARLLNRQPDTLRQWRARGTGPTYLTYPDSDRFYGYRASDLRAFIDSLTPVEGGAR